MKLSKNMKIVVIGCIAAAFLMAAVTSLPRIMAGKDAVKDYYSYMQYHTKKEVDSSIENAAKKIPISIPKGEIVKFTSWSCCKNNNYCNSFCAEIKLDEMEDETFRKTLLENREAVEVDNLSVKSVSSPEKAGLTLKNRYTEEISWNVEGRFIPMFKFAFERNWEDDFISSTTKFPLLEKGYYIYHKIINEYGDDEMYSFIYVQYSHEKNTVWLYSDVDIY